VASGIGAAAVAAALVAAVTACGGASGEPRATLTDDGCTYEGDTTFDAGMFTIGVENRTEFFGAFALAAITDGSTIEDLEAFIESAQRTFEQTGTLPEPPGFYEQVVRSGVEAESTSQLPADVSAGTYALVCFVDDLPVWRAHVAAQLDVSA
jgi:hypothetical protein